VVGVTSVTTNGITVVAQGHGAFAQNILTHLTEAGVQVSDMTMTSPDLEDVFLNLTGRSMRGDDH